jgi:hypothetical protein
MTDQMNPRGRFNNLSIPPYACGLAGLRMVIVSRLPRLVSQAALGLLAAAQDPQLQRLVVVQGWGRRRPPVGSRE